ncbi:Protein of unknown function [Gryllus bimaculatus]|nr:Protein of unknown function [Gryllus bimaculatus]
MDVVKHTFNDFIEETLIRFKYYHLQCEEAWLEEVNANNSMDSETEAHVDQYKQFMEERIEAYKSDSDGLRIVLDRLLESLFVSTRLNCNLTGQVEEVIQGINARTFLPPVLKKVGKRTKSLESRTSKVFKDHKPKQKRDSAKKVSTPDPAEGPKVPPVFRLSIDQGEKIEEIVKKQIKNIRTATSVDGQFEESTTGVPEYASMEGECEESDMLPCNVAALLSMSEEEFEDYVAKCNLMASKYVTSCKEEGKIWFKLFKKHAAKVKELYTVRYD